MNFFDCNSILGTVLGQPISYLEFFGTLAGAIAVWLSAKANIWSWPIGIINVVLLFFLFFQIQLYPDMFLQVFFFITNLMGWWRWSHPKSGEEDRRHELRVSLMRPKQLGMLTGLSIMGTMLFGSFASNLHEWFPALFSFPSAFPYVDSFVTVVSVAATFLMVQKKVECWLLWILADVVATWLYFNKGVMLMGIEYFVFCLIAIVGFFRWRTEFKSYPA